jgi:cysteine rich repeat protein
MKALLFASAAFAITALAGAASAQQPTQAQANAIRQSCRADYQAHCASVPTGGQAALACLQQNAASLSPPCQQSLAAIGGGGAPSRAAPAAPPPSMRQEAAVLRQACGMDYRRLCHGIRPGGGRALACLQDNSQSLSPQCGKALMAAQSGR